MPGELAVEMDTPTRLWVGVPVAQDATGKKLLVDTSVVAGIHIGDAPPAAPTPGKVWWHSNLGRTFVWYADANSSQWVEA